jgi:hypothetical protein
MEDTLPVVKESYLNLLKEIGGAYEFGVTREKLVNAFTKQLYRFGLRGLESLTLGELYKLLYGVVRLSDSKISMSRIRLGIRFKKYDEAKTIIVQELNNLGYDIPTEGVIFTNGFIRGCMNDELDISKRLAGSRLKKITVKYGRDKAMRAKTIVVKHSAR